MTRQLRWCLCAPLLWLSLVGGAVEVPESELARGPLPPQEAFVFRGDELGDGSYVLGWNIQPYYYMYLDKFAFAAQNPAITFEPKYSDNQQSYADLFFGDIAVFRDYVTIDLLVRAPAGTVPDRVTVTYQGCWDGGVCYPPQRLDMALGSFRDPGVVAYSQPVQAGLDSPSQAEQGSQPQARGSGQSQVSQSSWLESAPPQPTTAQPGNKPGLQSQGMPDAQQIRLLDLLTNQSDQRAFGGLLHSGRLWLLIMLFYLAGLALAFTPCVFPTIPLITGIVSRQGSSLSSLRGLSMMGVFVLCMSLTYTAAGVVAGLLGRNLQVMLQQSWITIFSVLLFVFLAGSMFGLYSLQLPIGLQNRLYKISSRQYQGAYLGLAIMGVFSALIVGPCLTAPLAGILIYLGNKGDPALGGLSLFVLGLGMGTPLLIVGLFAGKILPKAGAWMGRVQHLFGFAMLLLAVWMLDRILADDLVLLLYGIVVIAFAVYLLQVARLAAAAASHAAESIARTLGVVLLVLGVVQLVGFSLGSRDILQPLRVLHSGRVAMQTGGSGTKLYLSSPARLDTALTSYAAQSMPVVLKYQAEWCIECKIIDKEVFEDAQVQQQLANVALVEVDVTEVGEDSDSLLKRYGLPGPPALVFYDAQGQQRQDLLLLGNITKAKVLDGLAEVVGPGGANARR